MRRPSREEITQALKGIGTAAFVALKEDLIQKAIEVVLDNHKIAESVNVIPTSKGFRRHGF
jgi:hypothetical protein